jgi:hypothetical protein
MTIRLLIQIAVVLAVAALLLLLHAPGLVTAVVLGLTAAAVVVIPTLGRGP